MEKHEYRVKTEQMLRFLDQRAYIKAQEIADSIDWRNVKNANLLCSVSEIYEQMQELEKSREILFFAYDCAPDNKKIIYRLGSLALKMGDIGEAMDCYDEFIVVAPKDANQYILRFKILRAEGAAITQQIQALSTFKKVEYVEQWAYELAKLYHMAGMGVECVAECDELFLWFGDGRYIVQVLELKMQYKELTPAQEEKYREKTQHRNVSISKENKYKIKGLDKAKKENTVGQTTVIKKGQINSGFKHPKLDVIKHKTVKIDTEEVTKSLNGKMENQGDVFEVVPEEVKVNIPMIPIQDIVPTTMRKVEDGNTAKLKIQEMLVGWEDKQKHIEEEIRKVKKDSKIDEKSEPSEKSQTENEIKTETKKTVVLSDDIRKLMEDIENGVEAERVKNTIVEKNQNQFLNDVEDYEDTLEEIDLEEADLEEVDLEEVDQEEADLEEVDQEEADLEEADLEEVDLEEVDKEEADLEEVDLEEVDKEEAELEEVDKEEAELEEADLEEADLEEAELEKAESEKVDLEEADLEEAAPEEAVMDEDEASEFSNTEEFIEDAPYEDNGEFDEYGIFDEEDNDSATVPEFKPEDAWEDDDASFLKEREAPSRIEIAKAVATGKTAKIPVAEISKAIEASGKVGQDTGYIVQAKYDLEAQSEIGLRAGLTEEQKQLFSYFVPVRGMSEQLVDVLERDKYCTSRNQTSKTGNLLIIGPKGSGKTVLAVDVVKAIQKNRNITQGKVAIVTGEALNRKKISDIVAKLYGGALIIEKANKMNEKTVTRLNKAMERETGEMLFVLEDERKLLDALLASNSEFRKRFTSRLEVPVFINDELVTFGQTYAKENEFKIDEMGILALYSKIDTLQREDHPVTVSEVKDIIDRAIDNAKKVNVKRFAKKIFQKNDMDAKRIILTEKHFR